MVLYKNRMDKLIQDEVDRGEINGASVLVIHKQKEIYHNVFGFADKELGVPMKRDTIFRMFSMSKPVTAAAVMILAERGMLDCKDPVSRFLPEYAHQQVMHSDGTMEPAKREVTIWDLLQMQSGIPYPDDNLPSGKLMGEMLRGCINGRERGEWIDTREYARRIAAVPLAFHPGEHWMYGFSADILGAVVEVVSGKKYGDFLQDEIFAPLGMKDTGFYVPAQKRERFAQNYQWSLQENKLIPYTGCNLGEYYGEDVAFASGGAGLVSTIDDYSRFAGMMLGKGTYNGVRILGSKTVEFMTQDRLQDASKKDYMWDSTSGYGYGCLMRVLIDQGAAGSNASLGEYGWDGWTGNYVTISPKDDLVFLYFIQRCDAGTTALARKLRMVTYGALEG
jgi:CubicO group peptidase (beta-lactamase class C family)